MRTVLPVSPGEMLEEEFLKPLGLSKYRLAKDIGVPAQRIGEIVAGRRAVSGVDVDWASLANGGVVAGASNEHYGPASQVISPYPPLHMFDGFESARSRRPGHFETLEIRLGARIPVRRIILDFEHFVNNNPRAVRILHADGDAWIELVPLTEVKAFAANQKAFDIASEPVTNRLRFEIHPDGGINRVHVY